MKENDLVDSVERALEKRSRAIKHRGVSVARCRISDSVSDGETPINGVELEFSYRISGAKAFIKCQVWDDRCVWLDTRCFSSRKWIWECTLDGVFSSSCDATKFVALIEKTLDATLIKDIGAIPATVSALWRDCLSG